MVGAVKKHVIVCAAIRDQTGTVICGVRHMDMLMRFHINRQSDYEQGFVDNQYQFHDRKAAYQIALKAGQIVEYKTDKGLLYSEDLY